MLHQAMTPKCSHVTLIRKVLNTVNAILVKKVTRRSPDLKSGAVARCDSRVRPEGEEHPVLLLIM